MFQLCRFIKVGLALTLGILAGVSNASENELFADFSDRVEAERIKWGAPGLGVAVVHKDKVVFKGGFGVRSLKSGEPVNDDTLFHVGSTTKAFVAAALAILVDEGKLNWDDKVIDHLPAFRVADPYVTRELMIIDTLSHRSGVQNTDLMWYSGMKPDEVLSRLAYAEQSSSLRSQWEYNNGMYIVAGEVIEAISGQPFESFVRERLFKPLGMKRTTGPIREVAKRKNVAVSHSKINGKMSPIGLTDQYDPGAAGLFYSSVSEYTNWMRMWLNDGKLGDETVLSPESVEMVFTPHMILSGGPAYPAAREAGADLFGYGLGWFLHNYRGQRVNMHTGSLDGMSAIVGMLPDQDLGVVVFVNGDHIELRHALMYEVFDRVLGGEAKDWSSDLRDIYGKAAQQAAEHVKQLAATVDDAVALPLDSYVGLYRSALFGDCQVQRVGDQLTLKLGTLLSFSLAPKQAHQFIAKPDAHMAYMSPEVIPFQVGANNQPNALSFKGVTFERVVDSK